MKERQLSSVEQKERTRKLTLFAMLLTLELLLILTPLGYVPLGPIRATTLHIPVILCGILMGPFYGGILGGVFGLSSLINNTISPMPTSFVFSPFVTIGGFSGNAWSLWIALGPRILLGVIAALMFRALRNKIKNQDIAVGITAGLGTFLHTLMVMGSIYIFFAPEYASTRNITPQALLAAIGSIILVNGMIEVLVSIILCIAIVKVVIKFFKKKNAQ